MDHPLLEIRVVEYRRDAAIRAHELISAQISDINRRLDAYYSQYGETTNIPSHIWPQYLNELAERASLASRRIALNRRYERLQARFLELLSVSSRSHGID